MLFMRNTLFSQRCCTVGITLRSGGRQTWTQAIPPVLTLIRMRRQKDRLRATPSLRRIRIEIFPHLEEAMPP